MNIKPWEETLKAIKKGRERIKWTKRKPYANWKGNPYVAKDRVDLLKCNLSDKNDWNVRIYKQVLPELLCFFFVSLMGRAFINGLKS